MNSIWQLNFDDYMEIIKRAKAGGVKPGESIEKYFIEYMKEKGKKPIANTELTKEEFIAEQLSHDKKILNISVDDKGKTEYKTYKKVDNEE